MGSEMCIRDRNIKFKTVKMYELVGKYGKSSHCKYFIKFEKYLSMPFVSESLESMLIIETTFWGAIQFMTPLSRTQRWPPPFPGTICRPLCFY